MSKQGVKPLLDHEFELHDLLLREHRIERGSAHAVELVIGRAKEG
jgi:hypothetical protein